MTGRLLVGCSAGLATVLVAGCTAYPPGTSPDSPATAPSTTAGATPAAATRAAKPAAATVTVTASATPRGWAETAKKVRSGVVHISAEGCEGSAVGSGALVAPDLVLTAAHVVDDASTITLRSRGAVSRGDLVAFDPSTEIALVRVRTPLPGHVFRLSRTDPDEGTAVAALGYPLNQQLSITEGIVSAVGVSARVNGERVEDQLLASVAINPGNSGGPLVLSDGTLVGVVSSVGLDDDGTRAEGRSNSISATVARRAIAGLSDSARTIRTADCSRDDEQQAPAPYEGDEGLGEDERILLEVGISSDDPRASVFGDLIGQLGQGINDGDYEAAFDLFTDSMQRRAGGVRSWSAGLNSSYWRQLDIDDVSSSSEAPVVTVYLQTEQASAEGYQGQSCSVWHNRYYLQKSAGSANGWLIKRVQGAKPRPCA